MDLFNSKNDKKEGKKKGKKKVPVWQQFASNIVSVILIFLIIITGYSLLKDLEKEVVMIPVSELAGEVISGNVKEVVVEGEKLTVTFADDSVKESKKEAGTALSETLTNYGVSVEQLGAISINIKDESGFGYWALNVLPFLLPIIFLIVLFWLISRQVKGAGMQALSFGQSKARIIDPNDKNQRVTFDDVAGVREAKDELKEIVDFLKNPKKFLDIGARIPKGVLLMGAPGTGKCVTGDTRLLTQKGLIRIDEVPKYFSVNADNTVDGLGVVTLDPKALELKETRASHWYDLGDQTTDKIMTDSGVSLEGTHEHPVIVLDEESGNFVFRRLDEVKKNDFVALGYNTQRFGSYTKIPSADAAYLMGVLTGDGCLTIRGRIIVSTADKEILSRVQDIAKRLFSGTFKKTSSRQYDYELRDIDAKNALIEWGLSETYAEGKRVPEWVRIAPKEFVVAYLRGLFDTDGSAEKRGSISFSSSSRSLTEDVQMMLLNLGIVSRSYERRKKYNGKHQSYLMIYGDFVEKFRDEIGFTIMRKQKALLTVCERQRNTNINFIPHQSKAIQTVWNETVAATEEHLNRSFYNQTLYKNTKRYITEERFPSINGMNVFLDGAMKLAPSISILPEVAYLRKLGSGQFFFTRVKGKSTGMARVYDLTVPHTHNFLANGIINHNTLLARAVAGEAQVPFFIISGSEFVEMFVGVGASRVRDLFKMAKKAAPAIIFVDEIDAVGRVRGTGMGGGNDEREQTLNQILVEMDGFEPHEKVIVMAATNRPDVLDPALSRPGRFDRRVTLDLPDRDDREAILNIHAKKKPFAEDVALRVIAERTPGFSGADIYSLMNEAAILAAREDRKKVSQFDLIRSIEKVMLGPERKSHVLSKKEKKITAYHEAGHALVASVLPNADPVHKISIIARGSAGGYTLKLPLEEKRLQSRKEFLDDIAVSLGGYVAEKMIFGDLTTGPSNDLQVSTALARDMVTKYGMSESMGPVALEGSGGRALFGRGVSDKEYSEDVSAKIDTEIKKIMDGAFEKAQKVLTDHRSILDAIANRLTDVETIERDEYEKILIANGITPKKLEEEKIVEEIEGA